MNNIIKKIEQQIQEHSIILYMKGTPKFPKCGFSSKVAKILTVYVQSFFYVDVLSNSDIRITLPKFSHWPTFPQLWINQKLIGGSDIVTNMHNNGELKILIDQIKYVQTSN